MVPRSASAIAAANLADIRRDLEPAPGTPGTKSRFCRDCGAEFVSWEGDHTAYCADCGAVNQLDAGQQIRLRVGPVYERAVRGQLRHWLAEAQRLGITPEI